MSQTCQLPGRNFCAPDGKVAALFIDMDGTTIVCQPHFERAKKRFSFFMGLQGFSKNEAHKLLLEIERANAEAEGFERDQLSKSMVQAYSRLCKKHGKRRNRDITEICEDIGRSPFFREPELFPNAAAVLGRAHHNFLMIAVSIGNRDAQKYKVKQAGLTAVFDELIFTPRDDKPEKVRELIRDLNIDPKLSAFIGNSRRSDGACLQHTNFIFLPLEGGWSFDQAELPKDTGFEVFEVRDWREAEESSIGRLIRRRRSCMPVPADQTNPED